jgi:hypothetical protein
MTQVNQPGQTPGQQQEMDEQLHPSIPQEADSLNDEDLTEEDEEDDDLYDAGSGSDGGAAGDGGAA